MYYIHSVNQRSYGMAGISVCVEHVTIYELYPTEKILDHKLSTSHSLRHGSRKHTVECSDIDLVIANSIDISVTEE